MPYVIQQIPSAFMAIGKGNLLAGQKNTGKKRKKRPSPEIPITRDFPPFLFFPGLHEGYESFELDVACRIQIASAIGILLYAADLCCCTSCTLYRTFNSFLSCIVNSRASPFFSSPNRTFPIA